MKKTANKQLIAQHASYSRKYTVTNNTIPIVVRKKEDIIDCSGNGKWTKPEVIKPKEGKFKDRQPFKPLKKNSAAYMEAYAQHKLKRWLKKNPCPVKFDGIQQDMFEKEFLVPWQESKDKELTRCRDFVISVYDKLSLVGRYKQSEDKYEHKEVAKLKDKEQDISKHGGINNVPTNARLLKVAKKITDKEKEDNKTLVATNLLDHNRKQGRIILPKVALAA